MNNIIKFELRKASQESAPKHVQRLNSAIASMGFELAKNRDEVAGFQATMRILEQTVKNLEHSCETYLSKLERINVRRCRRRSVRLAGIMDGWLKDHAAAKARPI